VVSLGTVEPLPVIEKGNECLLMVIKYFTESCEVIPIVKYDVETIDRHVIKFCKGRC